MRNSPPPRASVALAGPFMDYILTGESLLSYNYSLPSVFFILLSCCIAVTSPPDPRTLLPNC